MVAILQGGADIEQPKLSDGYFLDYQVDHILDESHMGLIEKSVRIGFTYGDSFRNVRKRLMIPNCDYLFGTKDWPTALEYMRTCQLWIDMYNRVRSVVSKGEMTVMLPAVDEYGNKQKFDEEVKIGYIKFDNGSRILAFTSNPAAMQAYGGDVGLDEFAKHQRQDALYATAQGRVTWGFDLHIWSAHWGNENLFYDFALEARDGAGPWDLHRKITMDIAVEQGLVEKINDVRGLNKTREEFLADCRKRARNEDTYEQEYNCEPRGGSQAIVPWACIVRCKRDYEIERAEFESDKVSRLFVDYTEANEKARAEEIYKHLAALFAGVVGTPARYTLGFDVAASGKGDLAAIYVDETLNGGTAQQLRALLTCRTEDWHFIETCVRFFMDHLSAVTGAGDETGLGRQICWRLAKAYPGRFEAVNFSTSKHDMGAELMRQLSEANRYLPSAEKHADIAQDFYAMKKDNSSGKLKFDAGKNTLNPNSHGDIAWAGALSQRALNVSAIPAEAINI